MDTSDPVAALESAGAQLVDALRDQFVDGQAEALYSLQSAAAQLRRHAATIEQLSDVTTQQVSSALRRILAEVQASFGERLAAEVDAGSAELRASAAEHAHAVAAQLEATGTHLASLYDAAVVRTEDARKGLEWVAQTGAEQLTAAAASLEQARVATEQALSAAGDALRAQLAAATDESLRRLRQGTDALLAELRTAAKKPRSRTAPAEEDPR